eukprot:scaffold1766_cov401-Prasinococcus_capsulatus_cf.AAC.6
MALRLSLYADSLHVPVLHVVVGWRVPGARAVLLCIWVDTHTHPTHSSTGEVEKAWNGRYRFYTVMGNLGLACELCSTVDSCTVSHSCPTRSRERGPKAPCGPEWSIERQFSGLPRHNLTGGKARSTVLGEREVPDHARFACGGRARHCGTCHAVPRAYGEDSQFGVGTRQGAPGRACGLQRHVRSARTAQRLMEDMTTAS